MKRFEYKIHAAEFAEDYNTDKQAVRDGMTFIYNTLGAQGWQIVHIFSAHLDGVTHVNLTLMRELPT